MGWVSAQPRISHKVVTLVGKEGNALPQILFSGGSMHYLGIDIGKNNHKASLLDEGGKPVFKGFSFSNTTQGGESLLARLAEKTVAPAGLEVGLEATGHYWLSVYSFLLEKGCKLHVINPIQTDGWRKGTEIRKRKTDAIDATLIAELVRYGDFIEARLPDEAMLSLKQLTRFRSYLVDSVGDLKRKVICVLDQVFPEYQRIFSGVFGATSKELLLQFSSPSELENVSADTLAELLAKLSRQKLGEAKAEELRRAAANSFGVTFCRDSFSFQLRMLIEQIKYIESQVKDTEAEIKRIMDLLDSPIQTIPGIGPVLGAVILGEIGDIACFENPKQLVAFAGIDATVQQSGEFEGQNNRMSKRGSPYLRRALYQAAVVAATSRGSDPILAAFYQKKRSENKHHSACIGAVSRKMCGIIFAVLKENRPYETRNP
jgi:transposase